MYYGRAARRILSITARKRFFSPCVSSLSFTNPSRDLCQSRDNLQKKYKTADRQDRAEIAQSPGKMSSRRLATVASHIGAALPASASSGAASLVSAINPRHHSIAGYTLIISGASRGIGLAIALAAARRGANIAVLGKTASPDPRLPGTIYSAKAEIEAAGGKAEAIQCDVRDEGQVDAAVAACVARFGGIDVVSA